jgi:hypothetical protein
MADHYIKVQSESDLIEDRGEYRHWAPDSQAYAPADVLQQYLRSGWELDTLAAVETFYMAGYRRSDIYYFTLKRNTEYIEMPVLANPVVFRIIQEHKLNVLRINVSR